MKAASLPVPGVGMQLSSSSRSNKSCAFHFINKHHQLVKCCWGEKKKKQNTKQSRGFESPALKKCFVPLSICWFVCYQSRDPPAAGGVCEDGSGWGWTAPLSRLCGDQCERVCGWRENGLPDSLCHLNMGRPLAKPSQDRVMRTGRPQISPSYIAALLQVWHLKVFALPKGRGNEDHTKASHTALQDSGGPPGALTSSRGTNQPHPAPLHGFGSLQASAQLKPSRAR